MNEWWRDDVAIIAHPMDIQQAQSRLWYIDTLKEFYRRWPAYGRLGNAEAIERIYLEGFIRRNLKTEGCD